MFLAGSSLVTGVKATGVIGATDDIAKAAANSVDDVAKAAANSADDMANFVINPGKQGKHIVGHNNYVEGRSIFNGTVDDAQKLLDKFAGKGQQLCENKERVDMGKVIGKHYNAKTGTYSETTRGIIHYDGKEGAHIVPSSPREN